MKTDPGYPDNIRQFDHDPRSPFYIDKAEERDEYINGLLDEMLDPDSDSYEAVEWCVESPEVMDSLKQLLGMQVQGINVNQLRVAEVNALAQHALNILNHSETYIKSVLEMQER